MHRYWEQEAAHLHGLCGIAGVTAKHSKVLREVANAVSFLESIQKHVPIQHTLLLRLELLPIIILESAEFVVMCC